MANREEGAAAPNCRQGQEQPQHQDEEGIRVQRFCLTLLGEVRL